MVLFFAARENHRRTFKILFLLGSFLRGSRGQSSQPLFQSLLIWSSQDQRLSNGGDFECKTLTSTVQYFNSCIGAQGDGTSGFVNVAWAVVNQRFRAVFFGHNGDVALVPPFQNSTLIESVYVALKLILPWRDNQPETMAFSTLGSSCSAFLWPSRKEKLAQVIPATCSTS
jgi:hypothetical protein